MINLCLGILIFGLSLGFSLPVSTFAEDNATNSAPTNLTIDGVQYENVRWGRVTPATVTIFHKTGVASIPLSKLSPDLQKKFGYNPQKAAEWTALETKAQQQQTAAWHEEQHRKTLDQTQPLPMGVPTDALRSTLPADVSLVVLDEQGASDPFLPFQVLKFQLSFADPDSYQKLLQQFGKFIISGQSTINGRPFPKSLVESLKVQASGKGGKQLNLEWNPVTDLLPPLPGKYYTQIVLDTPGGKWITPLLTVGVSLHEKDEASLRFLIDNGGSEFFSHVVALRTRSESSLRQPPYAVIKQFIKTYPDSAINMVIVQHAEHARALDASQGPNYYLDEDREQLAEIIALAHPSMVQQLEAQKNTFNQDLLATTDAYRQQQDQKDINGMDRWIALLTKYTQ